MKDASLQMKNELYGNTCRKTRRCGLFKTCEICAKIRQAHIATIAEKLDKSGNQLYFTVLKPNENTQKAIKALRASIIRRKLTAGGLWTVEKGEKFNQLHLNLISEKIDTSKINKATSWSEAISSSTRAAAAYICKQKGIPDENQYSGQLYGTFGSIFEIATSKSMPICIKAKAIDMTLSTNSKSDQKSQIVKDDEKQKQVREKTKQEYQEIAHRHLANLFEITNSLKSQNKINRSSY